MFPREFVRSANIFEWLQFIVQYSAQYSIHYSVKYSVHLSVQNSIGIWGVQALSWL